MSIKHSNHNGSAAMQAMIAASVMVITALIVWLLIVTQPAPQAQLDELPLLSVVTVPVTEDIARPFESVTGRLQPRRMATLRFEVEGRVTQRLVEPGVKVELQQLLMELESGDYRDRMEQARVDLELEEQDAKRDQQLLVWAQDNVDIQQREVERLQRLTNDNLVAQSQLDRARQELLDMRAETARLQHLVKTAQSRRQSRQLMLDSAQRELQRTQLRAPFAGVVNEIFVETGDFVTINQQAITLVDIDALDLQLNVRGSIVAHIELAQDIEVQVEGRSYTGTIIALQPDPDRATHTHEVRIRLQDSGLLPGKLAIARLPLGPAADVLKVPVSAVTNVRDVAYVYVYENGHVVRTPVQLGYRHKQFYTVTEGLAAGDRVVARDVASLTDGQAVETAIRQ